MRLHLLSIPHTVTGPEASHCAFTGKVYKFPTMMKALGDKYEIFHYGVEGATTEADHHIDLMTREEQNHLRGHDGSDRKKLVGDDGDVSTPLYRTFNTRLRTELEKRYSPRDIILLPFGHAHSEAVEGREWTLVESGIGYPNLVPFAHHRIFESYAWMHWHQGKAGRQGKNYEWVVPNYFDVDDWDVELSPNMNRIVFLGRLEVCKGLETVVEIALHRPDLHFRICGQGDGDYWASKAPNIEYVPPLSGRARSAYLGDARACLMPTNFTEPFGGVAVEAMMCGQAVLSTSYGAFTETIEDEVTGFRCHTLGDFLAGLERAPELDRAYIAERARRLWGFDRIGRMYDRVFSYIDDLRGKGWYEPRSCFGPVKVTASKEEDVVTTTGEVQQEKQFNWIWVGGEWGYPNYLAIASVVKLHPGATFTLWLPPHITIPAYKDVLERLGVEFREVPILVPEERTHPPAVQKDILQWRLAEVVGGVFLDLDTLGVKPLSLLNGEKDLVVGQDVLHSNDCEHPWNNAVVAARAGSPAIRFARALMEERLSSGGLQWGDLGPALLTKVIRENDRAVGASFRVLGGYGGNEAQRLYSEDEPLPPEARVLHGFAASQEGNWAKISPSWIERSRSPYAIATQEVMTPNEYDPYDLDAWLQERGRHYRPMFEYLRGHAVESILEIGVFDGRNAAHMIRASTATCYWGVDLFAPHSSELRDREISQGYDRPPSKKIVEASIRARCPNIGVTLTQGDSRGVLPLLVPILPQMDFIYVDGGHSLETIRSDWEAVQPLLSKDGVVFFDDVFTGRKDVGALFLTEVLDSRYWEWKVLEPADQYEVFEARLLKVWRK